jgi:hypothetical protein
MLAPDFIGLYIGPFSGFRGGSILERDSALPGPCLIVTGVIGG